MRIRIVTPLTTAGFTSPEEVEHVAAVGTEVSQVSIGLGPASVESAFDIALSAPDTVAKVREAAAEGCDAVVIDCMSDPGLAAAREVVDIPVIGASQAAMHVAALLAHSFSVVTVVDNVKPMFEEQARRYGVGHKLRSVRSIDVPVLELESRPAEVRAALVDESVAAIVEDGAHAIVFGCTGLKGCATNLQRDLEERGHTGVPVIDPVVAALKVAEATAALGLSHSKRTYPSPPVKRIAGFPALAHTEVPA